MLQQCNVSVTAVKDVFPTNHFTLKVMLMMSFFYGKEAIVYGKRRVQLVMSQSPCVDLGCVP